MNKTKRLGVMIIFTVICILIVMLVLNYNKGGKNNLIAETDSLSSFKNSAGYSFFIPRVMNEEPNIQCKKIAGQLLEIENEHIKYRISNNLPSEADILGVYNKYDTDISLKYLHNDTVYRLRGTEDKIYFINWKSDNINYGINYKPGLEFSLALKYIDVDSSNIEMLKDSKIPEKKEKYTLEDGVYTDNLMNYSIDIGEDLAKKVKISCSDDKTNFFIQDNKLVTIFYIQCSDTFENKENTILLNNIQDKIKYSLTYISDASKITENDIKVITESFKIIK